MVMPVGWIEFWSLATKTKFVTIVFGGNDLEGIQSSGEGGHQPVSKEPRVILAMMGAQLPQ